MQKQTVCNNKCRTCFGQTKGLQPLGKLAVEETPRNISYAELLKEVANINVTDDKYAEMPQHICHCCCRKLKSSHAFIKQAQEVNAKLWSLLNLTAHDQKLVDCLEESEIDIQKCLEIKMESDQEGGGGGDNVKEEPVSLSEHYNLHPKKEINENISSDEEVVVKEDNNLTTTNIHKYLNVIQSSRTSVDSSESDMDDDKEHIIEGCNEEISSTDLQNEEADDIPQESMEQDISQTKPAYKKNKQQQKEILQEDADTDIAVPCLQCNKIFNNSKELSRHLRNTHVPEEQKCACPVCGAKFTRSCNMYKHMRTLHEPDSVKMLLPTKEKTHECEKCHRKYTKKKHLNYHIKIKHSKEAERNTKPLMPETDDSSKKKTEVRPLCFICGGSFSNKAHLIVHMRRHTGEKPFKCDLCDRAFPRISDLTCHRRIHTGEKPYKCKICEKTFRVSTKLATHMRSHTDERPYKCTQCERSFKYSKDLNIHTRIHTGERPYCCTVCGSTFTQSNSLKAHRMKLGHMESCT